jgi:hypothetical protein
MYGDLAMGENGFAGFRVASSTVPEPGPVVMLTGLGLAGLMWWWRRKRNA